MANLNRMRQKKQVSGKIRRTLIYIYIYDTVQDTMTISWPNIYFFKTLQNYNYEVVSYRKFDKELKSVNKIVPTALLFSLWVNFRFFEIFSLYKKKYGQIFVF